MFHSSIYYHASIEGVLCISGKDVPRQKLENLSQMSRFLCMHKILVHAQNSCACTTLLCMHWRGQGPTPGPNKKAAAGPARGGCFFVGSRWSLAPPVHAQECCACTKVLCMHKNLGPKNKPLSLSRCAASGGLLQEKNVDEKQ